VHGFPLDWNHWNINQWPEKIAEIEAETTKPVWVTEVGVSTFGADEVQEFGLRRTTELLADRVPRVFWYSLLDLPPAWEATTRHRESEGSSYYRHFYMGLVRDDRTPKPGRAASTRASASASGSTTRTTGSTSPSSGSSGWACGSCAPGCRGPTGTGPTRALVRPADGGARRLRRHGHALLHAAVARRREHHTSPPREPEEFADFAEAMVRRYVLGERGPETAGPDAGASEPASPRARRAPRPSS
jgi:hypothetical protein